MKNSMFSFTNFSAGGNGGNGNGGVKKSPTPRQIQYYLDLCIQRKVKPVNYLNLSYDELSVEIEKLRNFYPASENQIQMIKDKIENLGKMGFQINAPDFSQLTGGRTGTASALIEKLIEMERQYTDKMPPSDNQLQFMVSMYLCPDVDFESFKITRRVELEDGLWRRCTPEEFAEQIKANMTRREASAFIDKFRSVFHTWRQTRIRPEQQRYIRELEKRLTDMSTPSAIEWSIDQEGNLVQVQRKVDKAKNYNPTGYTPLDELELAMFSIEEASKYIDILKSELERKDLYQFREVSDESLTFEEIRTAKTPEQKKDNDYKALQDLIFKLEAVAGYTDEELHDAVTPFLLEDDIDPAMVKEQKEKIREFMLFLIEEEYISLEGMTELCKESEIAQEIMLGL